jgi:hypothetical protein
MKMKGNLNFKNGEKNMKKVKYHAIQIFTGLSNEYKKSTTEAII